MDTLKALLNEPVVIGLIVTGFYTVLKFALNRWADKTPAVQKFIDKYKAQLIRVVKLVEKEIPDGTVNAGAARLDLALKYLIKELGEVDENEAKHAITKVHAEIEHGVS